MSDQPSKLFCPSGHVLTGSEILSLYRRYKSQTKIGRPSGLSDSDVLSIKKRILVNGEQATALAEELGISLPYISLIVKGKRKAWVKLTEADKIVWILKSWDFLSKEDIAVVEEEDERGIERKWV